MNSVKKASGLIAIRDHHFYANLINSESVVIDLGSHLGQFSSEVSDIFDCHCYAVEALPSLYKEIVETPLLKKFNYAISLEDKPVQLCITDNPEGNHIDRGSGGNVLEKITVEGITIESFIKAQKLETIDLLKIDIEGAEIELFNSLSDETLRKIKQITVEFHDFKFSMLEEVESIKNRLKSLNFACVVYSRIHHGDVLFINKEQCKVPSFIYFYIQYLSRYTTGLPRMIKRHFKRKFILKK
jgi:FkbM family methyltransferase